MAVNELFSFGELEQKALRKYIAQQIADVVGDAGDNATAIATKLNADAGVTDTNYDTDPQA